MLIKVNDRIGRFAPQYYGSVQYYATLAQYARAVIDLDLRYDKRFKSVHRCQIVDTRGELTLTVPVSRPKNEDPGEKRPLRWNQITVSSQAGWWADHRVSLESAYGRTPFFEFYIDRFLPYLRDINIPITQMDMELDKIIRAILGLETDILYSAEDIDPAIIDDYRRNNFSPQNFPPYYQVRSAQLGFRPNLSILDLIFNIGPEAPLYLRALNES